MPLKYWILIWVFPNVFIPPVLFADRGFDNNQNQGLAEAVLTWGKFDPLRLKVVLANKNNFSNAPLKLNYLSGLFINMDYVSNTNIGSPAIFGPSGEKIKDAVPERLQLNFAGMDCVTYVENVLALYFSDNLSEIVDHLRKIKYKWGKVSYYDRNHYMVDWARNNVANGKLQNITAKLFVKTDKIIRELNIIPELGVRKELIEYIPRNKVDLVIPYLQAGDIILFVSPGFGLDFRHVGFITAKAGDIIVRHANRKDGIIDDSELVNYVNNRSFPGISVLRVNQ